MYEMHNVLQGVAENKLTDTGNEYKEVETKTNAVGRI